MDSNETEVCPIKKALEICAPSSLGSQLNWAVESDSVSSQAMDDAARQPCLREQGLSALQNDANKSVEERVLGKLLSYGLRDNLHALSVASTASKFVIWAPSGNGKASRTWVGNERAWLMWVGFSFFVKRCTCSIPFQETKSFYEERRLLWEQRLAILP
ncbi:hypothetical protein NC653_007992 [Populus alba x Populus x berolinensis]|uniref:Uncharacterized protein n=1 Tax=Populus alba x Populus x berolinensis TaxID=444605 RepID=A0AAD6R5E6_9ROSI|nr:hypothetical protein NC653_007992 [Populus alba x Populus x berolinensis]